MKIEKINNCYTFYNGFYLTPYVYSFLSIIFFLFVQTFIFAVFFPIFDHYWKQSHIRLVLAEFWSSRVQPIQSHVRLVLAKFCSSRVQPISNNFQSIVVSPPALLDIDLANEEDEEDEVSNERNSTSAFARRIYGPVMKEDYERLTKKECHELIEKCKSKSTFYKLQAYFFLVQFLCLLSTFSFHVNGFSTWDRYTNFYGSVMNGPYLIIVSIFSCAAVDRFHEFIVITMFPFRDGEKKNKMIVVDCIDIISSSTIDNSRPDETVDGLNISLSVEEGNQQVLSSLERKENTNVNAKSRKKYLKKGCFLDFIENDDKNIKILIDEKVVIIKRERIYNTNNIYLAELLQCYRGNAFILLVFPESEFPIMNLALSLVLPCLITHIVPGNILYIWWFVLMILSCIVSFFGMLIVIFFPYLLLLKFYLFVRKRITLDTENDLFLSYDFYRIIGFRFFMTLFLKIALFCILTSTFQVLYNYSSLYYNGYPYLDVIYQEFLLRSQLTCFLDHSFENFQQGLSFFSFL
jgi:hypothetical protein